MNTIQSILSETVSLCPVCLQRLPARRIVSGNDIFIDKTCPDHGDFTAVIWRGKESYSAWDGHVTSSGQQSPSHGCPFDCGLCPAHKQRSCCVLLNVTQRCNLKCPVCFAAAGGQFDPSDDPALDVIEGWYQMLLASGGPFNIQLSGGEPTVRDDLPAIIELGRELGFGFIQLNTNGIRLADDAGYAERLKQAGLSCVFLQFDGTTDEINLAMRGTPLMSLKQTAIEHCAAAELGVVLTPTLMPGVNIDDIGNIIHFAVRHSPAVRGVHFQPISYFGRYPNNPDNKDRITMPEIFSEIERQTNGLARANDFRPSCGTNVFCSFHANYILTDNGEWKRQTQESFEHTSRQLTNKARRAQEAVARRWSASVCCKTEKFSNLGCCGKVDSLDRFLEEMSRRSFFLSGMAFQDVWTLDLERLQECYVHVVSPDNQIIPFCAYNVTSVDGKSLYHCEVDRS